MIKNILIPIDGSESAEKALTFGLDIADRYSANIQLLTIAPPIVGPIFYAPITDISVIPPTAVETWSKEIRLNYQKVLSEAQKNAKKKKPKLNVTSKLVEGRPADKIIETAKSGNFDLIVMGSRGLSGIKGLFLGSVSYTVLNKAPCSVLIVKDPL